jgi:predicted enzyme related to lactoylglutathione lyase
MANRITCLTVDCADPAVLARFWTEALHWEVTESDDESVEIAGPGYPLSILFLAVPDHKQQKNRLHLDLNATDRDQTAELARLLALGATPVDIGQGEVTWRVLADPEGNEFCLLSRRVDALAPGAATA